MHKVNRATASLCSKNKIIRTWFSHKAKTYYWLLPANQCDSCCCLSETSLERRGFILASATLMSFPQPLFLSCVSTSSILKKDCSLTISCKKRENLQTILNNNRERLAGAKPELIDLLLRVMQLDGRLPSRLPLYMWIHIVYLSAILT